MTGWKITLCLWLHRKGWEGLALFLFVMLMAPIAGGVDTEVTTGAAEAAKRWAEDIWIELPERVFWGPYMQESPNSIIQVKKELESQPGDRITFTLARQLTGAGVQGDATLEGSEEAVSFFSDDVTLDQFRNAVRLRGKMSERRTAFSQRMTAKQLLKDWLAAFIDNRIFTALSTSPTRAVYGGDAVSTATIESGDILTLSLITRAKTVARKATPQIFPVQIEGGDYFLVVVSPDSMHDIKTLDPNWAQAQREAQVRGNQNPLFTGAEGIYDGCVIRSCTRVAVTTNWGTGANLNGSENLFCGRQAGAYAWGNKPEWVEQAFDYANKTGFAIGAILEVTKAVFNAQDNGLIAIRTYRTNVA
jgi:N4-gp56 family major capsid protein